MVLGVERLRALLFILQLSQPWMC